MLHAHFRHFFFLQNISWCTRWRFWKVVRKREKGGGGGSSSSSPLFSRIIDTIMFFFFFYCLLLFMCLDWSSLLVFFFCKWKSPDTLCAFFFFPSRCRWRWSAIESFTGVPFFFFFFVRVCVCMREKREKNEKDGLSSSLLIFFFR